MWCSIAALTSFLKPKNIALDNLSEVWPRQMPFADKCVCSSGRGAVHLTDRVTTKIYWNAVLTWARRYTLLSTFIQAPIQNMKPQFKQPYCRHALSPWLKLIFSSENTYQIIFWKAAFLLKFLLHLSYVYADPYFLLLRILRRREMMCSGSVRPFSILLGTKR